MKWLLLSAFAMACSTTPSTGDGGADGGCPSPVSGGDSCTTAGATACGVPPTCTDVENPNARTTCTCSGGKWDCGQCPACGATIVLGTQCGIGQVCSGPTIAKQCDGTTAQVAGDCICSSGGWSCSGVTTVTCAPDSGASDAATDASGD